ncbi:conserved hypothetical protein [Frankia canadensis]|uniref:Uncharacterized protein n=1 Tax=Frankia canadensis TaxID=1836972 RepID=A0A2I2KLU4_9ACTN|nr:DUF459 domain-containing protein [Frankia canadensis]SNQ46629.1 conserved hypothetical protein [Frankia canadensis]SOU53919.1 conserved hypothetical protein [Frankia canadensis]
MTRPDDDTVPARRAVLVVVTVLGLLAVLRAPAMVHAGEGMPPGLTRSLVLGAGHGLDRVSRPLGLDGPDRWLASAFGHGGAAPSATTSELVTAGDRDRTSPGLVAPGPPPLEPLRRPSAADPLRVLVTGDSLTETLGPAVTNAAPATLRVSTETHYGTGLVRPDFFDWAARARAQVAELRPEVVIVAMGGNDGQGMTLPDGTVLAAGSDAWAAEYRRRADVIMRIWTGGGARRLVWLSLPPARSTRLDGYFRQLNTATAAAAAGVGGARYLDLVPWLSRGGAYSDYLPDASGTTALARSRDGVHLTRDGARIAAGHIVATLPGQTPADQTPAGQAGLGRPG